MRTIEYQKDILICVLYDNFTPTGSEISKDGCVRISHMWKRGSLIWCENIVSLLTISLTPQSLWLSLERRHLAVSLTAAVLRYLLSCPRGPYWGPPAWLLHCSALWQGQQQQLCWEPNIWNKILLWWYIQWWGKSRVDNSPPVEPCPPPPPSLLWGLEPVRAPTLSVTPSSTEETLSSTKANTSAYLYFC